jgi:predicted outer membrane protein
MSNLTERRTKCLVMASTALALAAVVAGVSYYPRSLAEIPEASMLTVAATGMDKPSVSYWHVWTDEKGVSHQNRCEMTAFEFQSISPGAAPSWINRQSTPVANVVVLVLPVGWVGEWHENPKPQWIIPLSGQWFVETMDGKRVEMGPGEMSFGGDQNTKPDAQGRKGHRSGTVGDQPTVIMLVQLEQDPFVREQDAAPNTVKTQLESVDTYCATQTSLGTPLQVDSGWLAQKKGGTQAIRSKAELMLGSHLAVNDGLEAIVKRKAPVPPPTLLKVSYGTMISTLAAEKRQRFDADHRRGQVAYW